MKDLSMHIMDIFQNSIRAHATVISLDLVEDTQENYLRLIIADNSVGMSDEMIEKATNPFFTTRKTRNVGLGLPLLKQNAERTEGYLKIESQKGEGTRVIPFNTPMVHLYLQEMITENLNQIDILLTS